MFLHVRDIRIYSRSLMALFWSALLKSCEAAGFMLVFKSIKTSVKDKCEIEMGDSGMRDTTGKGAG